MDSEWSSWSPAAVETTLWCKSTLGLRHNKAKELGYSHCWNIISEPSDTDTKSTARLLVAWEKESGAWLTAPPTSATGLREDIDTIRIAVGLRLGSPIRVPHSCQHCGQSVDESGTHGLSCTKTQGRLPRHAELDEFVQRMFTSVKVPSTLEPRGLYRTDNRGPDGLSLIPWARGRALLWDVTVHDTYAPSYLRLSSGRAGAVAENAVNQKCRIYSDLNASHFFVPLTFEMPRVFAQDSILFVKDLARRIGTQKSDPCPYLRFCQRIRVILQRHNCASVLGTCNRRDYEYYSLDV